MVKSIIALVVKEPATLVMAVAYADVGPAITILEKTKPTVKMSPLLNPNKVAVIILEEEV